MASTFSPNLRIELIGYGEQNNTWGTTTNTNLGTLIEQAIAGKAAVDVTAGNVTLTAVDGAADQSRQMILAITGTPGVARTVTAPSVSKVYVVANGSNATITIKMATGTGVTVSSGKAKFVYCNGTDFYEATTEQASAAITNLTVSGTLTASGTITGTGFSTYLASPPAIGSTAASTGAFTTLSASSTVSGTGFSTYLASPPAIGSTTASTGQFTDLTSTGNTILGNATADTVTINGTIQPGVVISGSSSSDAFRITQTGSGNALVVEDSANPDSSVFQIDATGFVTANNQIARSGATSGTNGYGFSAENSLTGATNNYGFYSAIPSGAGRYNFYAAGAADNYFEGSLGIGVLPAYTNASFLVARTNSTAEAFFGRATADTGAFILRLYKSRSTSIYSRTIVQNNDSLGFIYFSGDDGTSETVAAQISVAVDGTPGTSDMPGRLVFSTTSDGASSPTERMRIDNAGNIYGTSGTTAMTNGFFYIPSAAGAPSGVPTAVAGRVPMYYDTTNNNFYVYNGAWKKVLLA